MITDDNDQQLVQRVQAGDKSAFDLLVLKYQHRVLKLVGRFVSDAAEAEDVAQEAFLKAYRALPRFAATVRSTRGCIASRSTRPRTRWCRTAAGRWISIWICRIRSSTTGTRD